MGGGLHILRKIRFIISIALLVVLLSQGYFATETKTAYTQDEKNFISKARLEENVERGAVKRDDYRKVQIPLDTYVAGVVGEDTSRNVEIIEVPSPVMKTTESNLPLQKIKIGLILAFLLTCATLLNYIRKKYNNNGNMVKDYKKDCNNKSNLVSQEPINRKKANVPFRDKNHEEGTKKHNTTIHEDPSLSNLVCKAYELNELGRYNEAIQACGGCMKSYQNNATSWERKAFAFNKLKRYDEAIAACNKSIEINPNLAYVWDNKAFALNELGRYNEAIRACERSIGIDPNNDTAWERKAFALKSLGETSESDIAFIRAYELRYQR